VHGLDVHVFKGTGKAGAWVANKPLTLLANKDWGFLDLGKQTNGDQRYASPEELATYLFIGGAVGGGSDMSTPGKAFLHANSTSEWRRGLAKTKGDVITAK